MIFCSKHWNSWEPVSLTCWYHILGLTENVNIICHVGPICCQTLKHFDNVFATGGNNIVEVFENLTSFLNDGHTVV